MYSLRFLIFDIILVCFANALPSVAYRLPAGSFGLTDKMEI